MSQTQTDQGPHTVQHKILYLDHTAKLGGGEIALINLLCAQDRSKFCPIVALASEGPLVRKLEALEIETYVLPLASSITDARKDLLGPGSLLRLVDASRLIAYIFTLARFIREHGVAIVHANSLKAGLYGGFAARLAGVPMLWHVRDHVDSRYLPAKVAWLMRGLIRRLPSVVVANSHSTLSRLTDSPASNPGVGGAVRMTVIHDGVDPDLYCRSEQPEKGSKRVALVGRIAPWKGQHVFIDAAAKVLRKRPDTRFQIVGAPLFGETDYNDGLHQQVADLGIQDSVEFTGFQSDVAGLLGKVAIVVHASTIGEPFGQVVAEGMAAAKPVIATEGGALPEIVENGLSGILVPMGDSDAMADAIESLLADPDAARAMGEAARRRIQDRFTIDMTARRVEGIYSYMLRLSPSRSVVANQSAT